MPHIKAMLTGLGIMLLCILASAFPYALLTVIYFVPGLAFGFLLLSINNDENYAWKNVLFFIICTFSYSACVATIGLVDIDFRLIEPTRIILASILGSLILTVSYQILILRRFSFLQLLVSLLVVGLFCSLPSTLLLTYFNDNHYILSGQSLLTKLEMSSVFIIFPLWQTAFVMLLKVRISLFDLPIDQL